MIQFRGTLPNNSPFLMSLTVIEISCFERKTVIRIGDLLDKVSLKETVNNEVYISSWPMVLYLVTPQFLYTRFLLIVL